MYQPIRNVFFTNGESDAFHLFDLGLMLFFFDAAVANEVKCRQVLHDVPQYCFLFLC